MNDFLMNIFVGFCTVVGCSIVSVIIILIIHWCEQYKKTLKKIVNTLLIFLLIVVILYCLYIVGDAVIYVFTNPLPHSNSTYYL